MQTTLSILEIVLLILAIVVVFAVLGAAMLAILRILKSRRDGKKDSGDSLEITHLDRKLADDVYSLKRSLLSPKERKRAPKRKDDQVYESTVFVVDFHPSLRAHEVDSLRKEV